MSVLLPELFRGRVVLHVSCPEPVWFIVHIKYTAQYIGVVMYEARRAAGCGQSLLLRSTSKVMITRQK